MRAALALFLTLVLAGCTSDAPDATTDPPAAVDTSTHNATTEPQMPVAPAGGPRSERIDFDYATADYAGELLRYRVVANDDTLVDAQFAMGLMVNGFDPGCAAFAAHWQEVEAPSAGNQTGAAGNDTQAETTLRAAGTYFVGWEADADVYADVHVAGQGMQVVPDQFDGQRSSVIRAFDASWTNQWVLPAGAEFVLDVGGSDPVIFQPAASGDAPYGNVSVQLLGDFDVLPVESMPLTCGLGSRVAEGGVGLSTYTMDLEHGGRLGTTTEGNSTMVVARGNNFEGTVTADFLGATAPATDGYVASATRGGEMGLSFDQWIGQKAPAWMFAEAYWPSV